MFAYVEYAGVMPGRDPVNPYAVSEIGKRLKLLREALGKTQKTMGDLSGVTDKAWQNYEKGIRRIEIDAVTRLRENLGITSEWVYYGNLSQMPDDILDKMQLRMREMAAPRRRSRL